MQTNLSGTQIAKLTAAILGTGFRRANSKEAAVKRFMTVAAERGIASPESILAMAYDAASTAIYAALDKKVAAKKPGKRAAALASAAAGEIPAPPDFSAPTHARFRGKLADLVALVDARDVKALKAFKINPISSSPKALDRYRNLAVAAIEAKPLTRPGDAAAIYAEETGVDYSTALVHCNMD